MDAEFLIAARQGDESKFARFLGLRMIKVLDYDPFNLTCVFVRACVYLFVFLFIIITLHVMTLSYFIF